MVVLDLVFHEEIKTAGQHNGWEWFLDKFRSIRIYCVKGSANPSGVPIEENRLTPEEVLTIPLGPKEILYISDRKKYLDWARGHNFHTAGIWSENMTTKGGEYFCSPTTDSIIGCILNIEYQKD